MSNTVVSLLKSTKEIGRDVAIMLLSIDNKSKNLIIQANLPPSIVSKGLKANEWINLSIPGNIILYYIISYFIIVILYYSYII
jgi:hypothetical protein